MKVGFAFASSSIGADGMDRAEGAAVQVMPLTSGTW
jgi:hypothetical protein